MRARDVLVRNCHVRLWPLASTVATDRRRVCSPNSVCCLIQGDVGVERLGKPIRTRFEARVIIEEDEVELRQRIGTALWSTRRRTIGAKRLFRAAANMTSFSATSEATE